MEEMPTGKKQIPIDEEIKRLQEFLRAAVGAFRDGEDSAGMENFLGAVETLEQAVKTDQNSPRPLISLNKLLPAVRGLYFYMKNQDITGITDLLEDTVYPLTEEWLKGCDDT